MAYTPHRPAPAETSEQLRARIPGWGVDLDPKDRPSHPKLDLREGRTGARWEFPERQVEHRPRERSVEHAFLTPVFGTAQPLRGPAGVLRRLSYARFSEARAAHWLLLVVADRVDAWEHHLRALGTLRPDDPVTETGVRAERTSGGIASRRGRVDVRHQALDPLLVVGPYVVVAVVCWKAVRALAGAGRR